MKLFQLYKKKNDAALEMVNYYSLLWDQTDDQIKFDAFIEIIEANDCKIVSMTYQKPRPIVDNRCMMVFGVRGTLANLVLCDLEMRQDPRLNQFRELSDI